MTLDPRLPPLLTPALPLRQASQYATVSLHLKSVTLAPVWLPPVTQPQVVVQLAGTALLQLTRQGHVYHYYSEPGTIYLNTAQQQPYQVAWQELGSGPGLESVHLTLTDELLRDTAAQAGLVADQLELLLFDTWYCTKCGIDLVADQLELLPGAGLTSPLLQQLGYSLAAMLRTVAPADTLYLESVAQLVATELVYHHSTHRPGPLLGANRLAPLRLRQLRDYIDASLHQPIQLADLAGVACLSSFHFSRLFKQATGRSPYQYVLERRMVRAQQLLRQGRLNVGQVARAVGYQSAGHFTRQFQRATGVLPAALRPV